MIESFGFAKDDVQGTDRATRTFDTSTGGWVVPDPPTDLYSVQFTSRMLHTETRRYLDGQRRSGSQLGRACRQSVGVRPPLGAVPSRELRR